MIQGYMMEIPNDILEVSEHQSNGQSPDPWE